MGLVVHQMAGFDPQRARETFGIPEGFEPLTMIAVGYEGSISDLPPDLAARESAPRTRKPLASMVFAEKWGAPAKLA
jgi:hypothetical protein